MDLIQQFPLVNCNFGSSMVAMPDLAIRVQIHWLIVTDV